MAGRRVTAAPPKDDAAGEVAAATVDDIGPAPVPPAQQAMQLMAATMKTAMGKDKAGDVLGALAEYKQALGMLDALLVRAAGGGPDDIFRQVFQNDRGEGVSSIDCTPVLPTAQARADTLGAVKVTLEKKRRDALDRIELLQHQQIERAAAGLPAEIETEEVTQQQEPAALEPAAEAAAEAAAEVALATFVAGRMPPAALEPGPAPELAAEPELGGPSAAPDSGSSTVAEESSAVEEEDAEEEDVSRLKSSSTLWSATKEAAEDCTRRGDHSGTVECYAAAMSHDAPETERVMLREAMRMAQAVLTATQTMAEMQDAKEMEARNTTAASQRSDSLDSVTLAFATKGTTGGFGMEITPDGRVPTVSLGGAAEAAGVPVPSRIVRVNGVDVGSKRDILAALRAAGTVVEFTFVQKPATLHPGEPAPSPSSRKRRPSAWAVVPLASGCGEGKPPKRIMLQCRRNGFGMEVLDDGTVLQYWGVGGPAELAGVPIGGRITRVGERAVATKLEIVKALTTATAGLDRVTFEFEEMPKTAATEQRNEEHALPLQESAFFNGDRGTAVPSALAAFCGGHQHAPASIKTPETLPVGPPAQDEASRTESCTSEGLGLEPAEALAPRSPSSSSYSSSSSSSSSSSTQEPMIDPNCVRVKLIKGATGGFGMEITPDGRVPTVSLGGVAEAAGVPVPSRIVRVNGVDVGSKRDILAALRAAGTEAIFVFATAGGSSVPLTAAEPAVSPWVAPIVIVNAPRHEASMDEGAGVPDDLMQQILAASLAARPAMEVYCSSESSSEGEET